MCVGWGPHLALTVWRRGDLRICWACWARGYGWPDAPTKRRPSR